MVEKPKETKNPLPLVRFPSMHRDTSHRMLWFCRPFFLSKDLLTFPNLGNNGIHLCPSTFDEHFCTHLCQEKLAFLLMASGVVVICGWTLAQARWNLIGQVLGSHLHFPNSSGVILQSKLTQNHSQEESQKHRCWRCCQLSRVSSWCCIYWQSMPPTGVENHKIKTWKNKTFGAKKCLAGHIESN